MKISCEQCSTVYELDARLIPATGAPVQCTRCGHVFTALPDGSVAQRTTTQVFGTPQYASADDEPPEGPKTAIYGLSSQQPYTPIREQTLVFGQRTVPAPEQPIRESTLVFGKAPEPEAPHPGTVTRIFGAVQIPPAAPSAPSASPPPGAPPASPSVPPASSGTQIFGAVKVPAPSPVPSPARSPSAPGTPPGTTTQMFGAVQAPAPAPRTTQMFGIPGSPPAAPQAPARPPGETTMLFGITAPMPSVPAGPEAPPKAPKPSSTQIFGTAQIAAALGQAPGAPAAAAPAPAAAPEAGSASPVRTQLFGAAEIEAKLAAVRSSMAELPPSKSSGAPAGGAEPSPLAASTGMPSATTTSVELPPVELPPEDPPNAEPAALTGAHDASAPAAPAAFSSWPPELGGPVMRTGDHPAIRRRTDEMASSPRTTGERPALGQPRTTGERPALGQPRTTGERPGSMQPRVTGERPALGQPRVTGERPALGHLKTTGEHSPVQPRRTTGDHMLPLAMREHIPVDLPPEGPPAPPELGLSAASLDRGGAPDGAGSSSRVGLIVAIVVALAVASFFGYRIVSARQRTAAAAPMLATMDAAMSLLRRDDAASQTRAYDQLAAVVREDPKQLEAQADVTLALALRFDDFRLATLRMQRDADVLDRKIARAIEAHATSDWQNRVTAMRDERRALQEQINRQNTQLLEMETRLNNAFAALPTQPFDQPSPREELALLRAQAVYFGVRGSEQAMILADHYREKSPNDGWDAVALAEYALNARASPELLEQAHKALDTLISRDSSFLRAYVLSARVSMTQKHYDVASNALEAVMALNPQHDLAPKLLSWTRQVERAEAGTP